MKTSAAIALSGVVAGGCVWEQQPIFECASPSGRWQATLSSEFAGGAAGACQIALEVRGAEYGWFNRGMSGRWTSGCMYIDYGVRLEWHGDNRLDVAVPDQFSPDLGVAGPRPGKPWSVDGFSAEAARELEVRFWYWPARPYDVTLPNGFADQAAAGCFRTSLR